MVHILRSGDPANPAYAAITPAQVQAQLDVLNQDFAALNADLSQLTGPTLSQSVPTTLADGSYTVKCQAIYNPSLSQNSGCPLSPAASRTFNVYNALIVDVDPLQRDGSGQVCADRRISLRLQPGTGVSNVSWTTTAGTLSNGTVATEVSCKTDPIANTAFTITATYQDRCGYARSVTYSATTASGTLTNNYDCSTAPQRAALQPPYPNPADKSVTLKGFSGACTLYNSQGQPVARYGAGATEGGRVLDTQSLPNGFYAVVGQDADGTPRRYMIQVQH